MKKVRRTKLPKFRLGAENFVRRKILSDKVIRHKPGITLVVAGSSVSISVTVLLVVRRGVVVGGWVVGGAVGGVHGGHV